MTPVLQVGIDPAKNKCVAKVVDQFGNTQGKGIHFVPNRPGVAGLLRRVQNIEPQAQCRFFIEASALHWYAPAAILRDLNQHVSLITPSYTAAQRKSMSRYAKSDAKDAEAIARVAFNIGEKANHPADIPEGPRLNLRMLCRHRHRLQGDATAIKLRIIAWLGLTTPGLTQIIGTDLALADRAFISKYPVVARVLKLGKNRLRDFLQRRAEGQVDQATVDDLFQLAREAYSPRDFDDQLMARQIQMELERLELIEKHIGELDQQIKDLTPQCDPQGLARSLPGFGPVIAPIMVAEAGTDLSRFATAARFASWTGTVGRASETAGRQKEGLPITKAGRSIVKWALHRAATVAVMHDPEIKQFYDRLRANRKHHNVAITAVANKLARIYWAVMTQQRPFQERTPAATHDRSEQ